MPNIQISNPPASSGPRLFTDQHPTDQIFLGLFGSDGSLVSGYPIARLQDHGDGLELVLIGTSIPGVKLDPSDNKIVVVR